MIKYLATLLFLLMTNTVHAASVVDDEDNKITLDKPAIRVITLAPSLTEMLYTFGAEDKLVATVQFSNYPEAAKTKPHIGNYERFVMERLLSFKPDLVVAWASANNSQQLKQLEKFNIPVYRSEPRTLADISKTIRNLGVLTGLQEESSRVANKFDLRLKKLQDENKNKNELNAFYQVWHQPVYTINGEHVISKVMKLCKLKNVFENSIIIAPKVTVESVIKYNPDLIIASGMASSQPEWLDQWIEWPAIRAVEKGNLFFIPPDLIQRQSIRLLDAAEIMCEQADKARSRLNKK